MKDIEAVLARTERLGPNARDFIVERAVPPAERLQVHGKAFTVGGRRMRINGVTYGPFAANAAGEPFPAPERVRQDFATMRSTGINAIRTYHLPPERVLEQADEAGIGVLIDAPWRKHLCFLDSEAAQKEARKVVGNIAARGRRHDCVLAYSVGNEIPPDVVRWHGANRVERFISELADVARQTDPEGLVTYANFPPTEYLELPFLDFATFNVYLHDRDVFRRYLVRIQNLVGEKPLVLGELGLDTMRHGEMRQAEFLTGHLREAALMGLAGAFIFSWTDDWHTGGFPIEDWAFGITHRDRFPKASLHALHELFRCSPREMLPAVPRVSVVVCSYNGARTLEQCLRSLAELDYPDYEVIVVNDGSTDETRSILSRFPSVRAIHQENLGLSAARNAGLRAATGSLVAYTDADCFADPDWLTHLVYQFERTDAAAVGGPNLTPEDGWLAGCVAAAPGQPMHVLESDHVAEHIPGCNMAFRRDVLLAIDGFDVQYRKAGDDVDVCWRLQQAGYWITFAPGAFVWHHRRQNPRAYLRQQAGYGEAEALLRFKHPDRFNGRGDGKWRGILYGTSLQGLRLKQANVYRGVFGTGLFQTLYTPGPAHWASLPSSLEWLLATLGVGIASLHWPLLAIASAAMFVLSVLVAGLQARQACLAPEYMGLPSRLVLTWLCYAQPLVRSWSRYRTRFFAYRPPLAGPFPDTARNRLSFTGKRIAHYWTEDGSGRIELLGMVVAYLNEHRWGKTIDAGWRDWDLEIYCHPWTVVQVCTVQEEHGSGKRLIQARFRLRASGYTRLLLGGACGSAVMAAVFQLWPAAIAAALLGVAAVGAWVRGVYRAGQAVHVFDIAARQLGLVRCDAAVGARKEARADAAIGARIEGQFVPSEKFVPSENGARIGTETV
ncbi:MAG: glycosyltransferase [Deltaproteobacteria bacterium]